MQKIPRMCANPSANCSKLRISKGSYGDCFADTGTRNPRDGAGDEEVAQVVAGSSSSRVVREKGWGSDGGMIQSVDVSDDEVKCLVTISRIVDKLA